jgi:uncharacterized Zn finger protein
MQNKIPCAAQQLNQLEPAVIQSVADAAAFTVGNQYLLENRVRILEADDVQISAAVIGNSGLYKQTIRLKAGSLVTKCSCPLAEQPFCRHCVAVLLEFHRSDHARAPSVAPERSALDEPVSEPEETTSPLGIKLREMTVFIDWVQMTVQALDRGHTLPAIPELGRGEVLGWIRAIQGLDERRQRSEEKLLALEYDLSAREAQLHRMTQQVEASTEKATQAQEACEKMQREVASFRGALSRVAEVTKEIDRLDSEIKGLAGDLVKKGSMLDGQAVSLKKVSESLHALLKPPPH